MTKQFKIVSKEPYKFTAKSGQVYDKCRYKTDSDVLDIFAMNLEIGQTYSFEEVEKEANGRVYKNWQLIKPKNSLELRIDMLESRIEALENAFKGLKQPQGATKDPFDDIPVVDDEPDLRNIPF